MFVWTHNFKGKNQSEMLLKKNIGKKIFCQFQNYLAQVAHGIIASTALTLHWLELIVVDNYQSGSQNC